MKRFLNPECITKQNLRNLLRKGLQNNEIFGLDRTWRNYLLHFSLKSSASLEPVMLSKFKILKYEIWKIAISLYSLLKYNVLKNDLMMWCELYKKKLIWESNGPFISESNQNGIKLRKNKNIKSLWFSSWNDKITSLAFHSTLRGFKQNWKTHESLFL